MVPETRSGWIRTWWLWTLAAIVLLAGFEGWVRPAWRAGVAPAGTAEWIWAHVEPNDQWVGFFAVRDFELESRPDSRARLLITADEDYVVFLNGHPIGSGSYEAGAPIASYDVTPMLVEGTNRLLVELRSLHSVGGMLLSLEDDGGPLVVSDGAWRAVSEYREAFKWPGAPLADARPVVVWGRSPSGRWRIGPEPIMKLRLRQQLLSRRPLPAESVRTGPKTRKWRRAPARPSPEKPIGTWATFDFGREVSGYLNVAATDRGGTQALFWAGLEAPRDPKASRPTGKLQMMVGQGSWTDAVPRRFRYVTVVSLTELAGARTFVLDPELEASMLRRERPPVGVLGLEPPVLRSPVEDEFWREFESQSRVGSGEDL